jgi:hypothetical protein
MIYSVATDFNPLKKNNRNIETFVKVLNFDKGFFA